MVYYKLKETTPVNYLGMAKLPTFRNGDTALTAGLMLAIDRIPGRAEFTEPAPNIVDMRSNGINIAYSDVEGYDNGNLVIPDHNVKSGKWWYYVVGSCTTVSATYETHTLSEADSQPYLGLHGELEHETTSYNKIVDMLGVSLEGGTLTFGQQRPMTQSFTGTVAFSKSGNNLARTSALDYKANFLPGKFSALVEYGGTTTNYTILEGTIRVMKEFEYIKSSNTYTTESILLSRDYEISLTGLMSDNTLFTIPDDPLDYSSNTLTFDFKPYRNTTSDYIRFSFNNLRMDKLMAEKIDEGEYIFKARTVFHNCGARTAVSRGTLSITIVDDLTANHYER